jgi:EpsD family peptidyl-prolyl cis-trans isomerase
MRPETGQTEDQRVKRFAGVALAALVLTGCGDKKTAPTGQVVATVNGKEVTVSELRLEQGGAEVSPEMQQVAFQNLLNRKMLAEEARRLKLDRSPQAAIAIQRAEETALVQLLEQDAAKTVPQVSQSEAQDYIRSNPANFAERQLISVDQLMVPDIKPDVVKLMQPLETLQEIEALLVRNSVRFFRTAGVLDTLTMNGEGAAQLGRLPTGAVFVSPLPGAQGVTVSRITARRTEPLEQADAERAARQLLAQQRGMQQVRSRLQQVIEKGQKSVEINPQFKPKAAPAAAKPAAAATPAAPAARPAVVGP